MSLIFALTTSYADDQMPPEFRFYRAWQWNDMEGCRLGDKLYSVGEKVAMNDGALKDFTQRTGRQAADGYAVLMQCNILITNPRLDDHPALRERVYVWTAFNWWR
ncbi:hypothetical protein ACP3V5_17520 [Vibrio maritimus]